MLSASCSSAPTRENSHCDIIRKSFISLNFAVLAPTTTTQLSSVSGYSLIHKQWGLWPYFELLSMIFKENMKHDSYCCIQAMTLWQNELSAFMIKKSHSQSYLAWAMIDFIFIPCGLGIKTNENLFWSDVKKITQIGWAIKIISFCVWLMSI